MTKKYSDVLNDADSHQRMALHRNSLGDEIYDTLLAQLISLKIPPGERLSVDALVRDFAVSQTPIRAALIRLEAEGLVVKKHNSGYSAAPLPSGERFRETYEMRLLIEPYAAMRLTELITKSLLKQLTALAAEMSALVEDDPRAAYGRFAVLDAKFHEMIAENCGNSLFAETLGRLYAHMNLFRLRYHSTVTSEAVKEHAAIVEAIKSGNAVGAGEAMRQHILNSQERMKPIYRLIDQK